MAAKKLLLTALLASASAFAQAPIGTAVNVTGVVTATTGTTGTTLVTGAPIQNGMRIVTTSNATATLRLNNGCQITVPPSHGVTVLSSQTCDALVAAVQPVVPVAASGPFGVGPGANAIIGGVGALIAIGIIAEAVDDDDDQPLSAQ